MQELLLPNNWTPRPYQRQAWDYLENGGKRVSLIWHRRAGKDSMCLNWTATAAIQRPATYWHMLPKANQARKAVWEAVNPHTGIRLIDQAFPLAIRETTRENEMLLRLKNGATWQVVGSDNFNALVGSPPLGIVFSEWALCDPTAWSYLRMILAENGGWALFITTPRGKNHAHRLHLAAKNDPAWFDQVLTVNDTKAIGKDILDQERKELVDLHGDEEGNAMFNQEYLCSFEAPLSGSYYGAILAKADTEKRIGNFPYDPALKVHTAWDLGIDDSTAIWFIQVRGPEVRWIDYYQNNGEGLAHYANVLQARKYVYGTHWAPHDIKVRELGTGKSRLETAAGLGLNFTVAPDTGLADGIEATRNILATSYFNEPKVAVGLDALRNYRREWDEDNKVYKNHPLHDWTSHAADAGRIFAQSYTPGSEDKLPPINYPKSGVI